MNNVDQKRQAVASAYPSPRWKAQVRDMRDGQVVALYLKFKKEGRIK